MEHLEEHQHAFLDENNIVMLVAIFDKSAHGSQLIEDIKLAHNAKKIICCCDNGIASIGQEWTGSYFKSAKPEPLIFGDVVMEYYWNEEIKDWDLK